MSTTAQALLQQGQQLEAAGDLSAAFVCYDGARAELRRMETATDADRSVVCMNLGSVLTRMGPRYLAMALAAYNEAIALKRRAEPGAGSAETVSLAAALINRGSLLHRLHGAAQAEAGFAAFDEAVALLRPLPLADGSPWIRRNLAGALLNRAALAMDAGQLEPARENCRVALVAVAAHERHDAVDADLSLKLRRLLCDALGHLFVARDVDQDGLAREAAEAVDEAMDLARHWLAAGVAELRPLALRLFRFGAQLYRLHQPHFLAEFLRENLVLVRAEAEFLLAARENIVAALAAPSGVEFFTIGDPASERRLETERGLRALLAELSP